MASAFQNGEGGLWAEQSAGSSLDYSFDWSLDLNGDTVASSTWSADAGLTTSHSSFTTTATLAWISGGVAGQWYVVRNTVVFGTGRTDSKTFRLHVLADPTAINTGVVSVFTDLGATITTLRRDRLVIAAQSYLPGVDLSDDYLIEKLLAAEADVQRQLRIYLTPRQMVPQGTTDAEVAAFVAAAPGVPVVFEPGYDYTPALFNSDTWGLIETRQRPIIAVQAIRFAYPSLQSRVFDVPLQWVRMDAKYGKLNLVPTQDMAAIPLSSYLLQVLGGGSSVPFMLQVTYTCGLTNAARDYPDLLNLIRQWTVLGIIDDQFLPSSGSTSADGLSQSISWDADKMRASLDARLDRLRQSMNGVRFMVC